MLGPDDADFVMASIVTSREEFGPYTRARVCTECGWTTALTEATLCTRCGCENLSLRVGRWKFLITTTRLFRWFPGGSVKTVLNFVGGRYPWKEEQ